MQPLISVDRELRHNSNRVENEPEVATTEDTPLLHRFPPNYRECNLVTTVIVSFLVILLIAGAVIGIYLLVLQSRAENVLPPVQVPLQFVTRSQWDNSNTAPNGLKSSPRREKQVIVVQTGTEECFSTEKCTELLQMMQANATSTNGTLPYNFLISSKGETYEALGWHRSLPSNSTQYSPATQVVAFIGNFTHVQPSRSQIEEAKNLFAVLVSRQYLDPSYNIIGKTRNDKPKYLFQSLKELPEWNDALSDTEGR